VGLFGGTFNPIHLGHLRSAEEIREAFALDRIFFVPAAHPPHKAGTDLAPATHRLRMVELATADNPFFSASAVELERAGTSYSVDTIRHFLATLQPARLFFIMGLDAFHEMHTWKDYLVIPELCDLIVTSRPGISTPSPEQLLPVVLRAVFWYDPTVHVYRHSSGHTLASHDLTGLHISASAIRDIRRRGKSVRYLVPPAVEAHMMEHALYQPEGLSR
ncbi:MAG: nicotinate-nucleotide adenylyltransferase, partial [Candidatus Binatia bacterium]